MPAPYQLPPAWESAVQGWLAWLRVSGCSPLTLETRRGQVRSLARRSHTRHPNQITLNMLVALCGRDWSNEHRRGVRAAMSSFGAWCVTNHITPDNPAAGLPAVPEDRPHPRPTPDKIWDDLLEHAGPREQLMALLAGETGLRRAEIAGVHADDLVREPAGWSLIVRGKGGKQRVVAVTDHVAELLTNREGWVFPSSRGGHLAPRTVGKLLSNLMPAGWSAHSLRHRFASRGYAGTHDLAAVQLALGHSSPATTLRYTAITSDEVRAVTKAAAA